eukprot:TRINITY_DN12824_c0_g2_i3.p1 TRINITY_DN12824_c0_g2~~TRINITY_DN12824_c0_g2_i3.p1  ORF type:complete len:407 (+),score=79.24 TRINITY_DN12824_c0_g2_i3:457-1677(+)
MIEWMLKLGVGLQVSNRVIHMAVFYVDYLTFKRPDTEEEVYLYGAAAMMLASKAVEKDERVPYVPKIEAGTANSFSKAAIRRAELALCDALEWHLQHTTLSDILSAFFTLGVLFSSDEVEVVRPPAPPAETIYEDAPAQTATANEALISESHSRSTDISNQESTEKLTKERAATLAKTLRTLGHSLAELVLADYEFYGSSDEVLGSAMVAFLRRTLKITPIWPAELEKLTGVTQERMKTCLGKLTEKFSGKIMTYVPVMPQDDTHLPPSSNAYYHTMDLILQREEQFLYAQQLAYQEQLRMMQGYNQYAGWPGMHQMTYAGHPMIPGPFDPLAQARFGAMTRPEALIANKNVINNPAIFAHIDPKAAPFIASTTASGFNYPYAPENIAAAAASTRANFNRSASLPF